MRSRARRIAASRCALWAAAGPLLLASSVPAAAQTLSVVVAIGGPDDRAIAERVYGQVSDLELSLQVQPRPSEPGPDGLAARLSQLSQAHGAQLVVWFSRVSAEPPRLLVFASFADGATVLLARVHTEGTGSLSSGELETAALVVRTSLQALIAGERPEGVMPSADEQAVTTAVPAAATESAPSPAGAVGTAGANPSDANTDANNAAGAPAAERARDEADSDTAAGVSLHGFVGFSNRFDGSAGAGRQGLTAQLGVQLGALLLGVDGAVSLAEPEPTPDGELRIARHDVSAAAAYRVQRGAWALWAGARVGLALYHRSTDPSAPDAASSARVTAADAAITPAGSFGPWLGAAWLPGPVGLGLQLSADVMPDAPRFVLQTDAGAERTVYEPPTVSLRIDLGVQARFL